MSTHLHGHHHDLSMSADHGESRAGKNKSKMLLVFLLTSVYMIAEAVGGYLTHSLALLADAGHMLTDAGALGLALFAIWFAERPATPQKTYGYYRAEILAAVSNAVLLLLISFYILYEAWVRFQNPPIIDTTPMMLIATAGLFVNLLGMKILAPAAKESLNISGAYLEVLSDMIASVGVIASSILMKFTGFYWIDPVMSVLIGLWIFPRTWKLLNQGLHILMEGTPHRIDLKKLEEAMLGINGVLAIHDLHVWTITSGVDAMSAHVTATPNEKSSLVLAKLQHLLKEKFSMDHVTIQIEEERCSINCK